MLDCVKGGLVLIGVEKAHFPPSCLPFRVSEGNTDGIVPGGASICRRTENRRVFPEVVASWELSKIVESIMATERRHREKEG